MKGMELFPNALAIITYLKNNGDIFEEVKTQLNLADDKQRSAVQLSVIKYAMKTRMEGAQWDMCEVKEGDAMYEIQVGGDTLHATVTIKRNSSQLSIFYSTTHTEKQFHSPDDLKPIMKQVYNEVSVDERFRDLQTSLDTLYYETFKTNYKHIK